MKNITTIYRKEFLDIIRDRKTLIFALLLPTVAIPLLMMTMGRTVQSLAQKEQQNVVTVYATNESQIAYRDMIFAWFRETPLGQGIISMDSEFMRAVLQNEYDDQFDTIPENVTRDPEIFSEWIIDLSRNPDKTSDNLEEIDVPDFESMSQEMTETVRDFYNVAIQGYGLIDFKSIEGEASGFNSDNARQGIVDRQIDAAVNIPSDWSEQLFDESTILEVELIYDSTITKSSEARNRIRSVINSVSEQTVEMRIREKGYDTNFLDPVIIAAGGNLATKSRQSGQVLGMILPYLVVVFSFLGGLFPALDLGAGEKERLTLETLLLSPCSRLEIALGKYFVILTTSLMAAFLGVMSIYVSFKLVIPEELRLLFDFSISVKQGVAIALLAIPPAAIFSGLFLALSIYARSFKEAQNYLAPVQFLLFLPALAPVLPGIEMTWKTALIPLVNVSLLSRDFLKGDIDWLYYSLTFSSCAFIAFLCIMFSIMQFNREKVLFRS